MFVIQLKIFLRYFNFFWNRQLSPLISRIVDYKQSKIPKITEISISIVSLIICIH